MASRRHVRAASAFAALVVVTACPSDERPPPPGRQAEARDDSGASGRSYAVRRCSDLDELVQRVRRGWHPERSPEVSFVVREPHFVGFAQDPTHTGPWDFLVSVPLVMYGPEVIAARGRLQEPATSVDLAPTIAALVRFGGWDRRDGRPLEEAMVPGADPPRLVLTVVWDGGGDNALEAHPNSWPFLRSLIGRGASFENMTIGSTPSNTPPVHATIGTGAWPGKHGITAVKQRTEEGEFLDPWIDEDPANLELATLGDLYDRARGNSPLVGLVATVNWHLGMIGHGSALPGADRDLALLLNSSGLSYGNSLLYEVPALSGSESLDAHTRAVDASDGRIDEEWRGHRLDDLAVRYATPAYTAFQEDVLEATIREHGFGADRTPDLLYVNFKQPDDAGHKWGIESPEVGAVLRAQDRALRDLVRALNRSVGRGGWALFITADHGMMPYPRDSKGWPVGGKELLSDVNRALDITDDGVGIVERVVAQGAYLREEQLRANNLEVEDVARWLGRYSIEDNVQAGERLPGYLEGRSSERLLDATVVEGRRVVRYCRRR